MKNPKKKPARQRAPDEQARLDVGLLPVGVTRREPAGVYKTPDNVQSSAELPARLYLGSLVESTFHKSAEGWDVRYEDANPETYVSLEYRRTRNLLVAHLTWNGIDGMSVYCPGNDWKQLAQRMSMGFPKAWDEGAKQDIEAEFNARYIVQADDAPSITGFPDGARRTLVFPLPSYRLPGLPGLLDAMDSDETLAAVVSVTAVMTQSRVDYIQGRCEDIPDTPEALARQSRLITGLPCHGVPGFSIVEDSIELLSLDRWVYLVHVGCAFRDLGRVMSHCQQLGLIGSPDYGCAPSDCPDGGEWTAIIMPGGYECMDARLQYLERTGSRRIAYGRLISPDRLSELTIVRDFNREDAHRRLMGAMTWALSQPDVDQPENESKVH